MKRKIICIILTAALCLSLLPVFTLAAGLTDSGTYGAITWTFCEDDSLRFYGSGEITAIPEKYRDKAVLLVIGSGVSGIASEVFYGCTALKTAVFEGAEPANVGENIFGNCAEGFVIHVPRNELSWESSGLYNKLNKTWNGYPIHFTDRKRAVAAGCETEGYSGDRFCNNCGDTVLYGSPINPTGHNSVLTGVRAATCVTSGYTGDYVCTRCHLTQKPGEEIPAKGHIWDDGKVSVKATETEEGVMIYTCYVCQSAYSKSIPKLDHIHNYTDTVTEPTCTAQGFTTHTCACGDSFVNEYTDALGHTWDKGKVTVKPTEIKAGLKTYTCSRCGAKVHETLPIIEPIVLPFIDVERGNYFYDSVAWAYSNGITGGTDTTHFDPHGICTRAHVVTFLWRAAGSPEPMRYDTALTDVAADAYYYKAVLWAVENGITTGYEDGSFRPNNACTRAHVVTFLWRYENRPAPLKEVPLTDLDGLSTDFIFAIKWAASTGITTGYEDGSFRPSMPCTRAHVVTFLWRDIV